MQTLSRLQVSKVFGGDNPGMGPYAPPVTAEIRDAYMNAMKPLLGALGPASGFLESKMFNDFTSRMQSWNQANGFDAMGTAYQWPSGTTQPVVNNSAHEIGTAMSNSSSNQLIECIAGLPGQPTVQDILDACYPNESSSGMFEILNNSYAEVMEQADWDYGFFSDTYTYSD
jgi:hypothetical protein